MVSNKAQEALQAQLAAQAAVTPPPPPKTVYTAPTPVTAPTVTVTGDIPAIITHWANVYGVSPAWLLGVAKCESGFNIYAHNPSGATGLFQFMPSTFYGNGGMNLYDPNDQAHIAAKMFAAGQSGQWVCK